MNIIICILHIIAIYSVFNIWLFLINSQEDVLNYIAFLVILVMAYLLYSFSNIVNKILTKGFRSNENN